MKKKPGVEMVQLSIPIISNVTRDYSIPMVEAKKLYSEGKLALNLINNAYYPTKGLPPGSYNICSTFFCPW